MDLGDIEAELEKLVTKEVLKNIFALLQFGPTLFPESSLHNEQIYSSLPVISSIEPQLNTSSSDDLKEALAELYVIDGQFEKAFNLYAAKNSGIFDFIDKHNLHDGIRENVLSVSVLISKQLLT
ncbi:vacuolar protein sorting-associated protein 41 homolog [Phtheirospermum japonicum]|uniref:Vacuolar protein sorting-associated protein 41 homolog n=1 Tax=Phtheirospermum japonicum TaxID=374723 RepID=A0A830D7E9_9LAMI|nr:vacuolar protein sorting-associated protein 41 homolog [Phtheirospermum japonicum]